MTALLGIAALSIDASFMYDKRNRLHAAADAAAKSGALEVLRNSGITHDSLVSFAKQQVVYHGFNPFTSATVVVNHPPTSGAFTGNAQYVEVYVSEATSTFFGKVLGWFSMTPGGRAVAGASSGPNCIVTLGGVDPPAASPSFSLGNSTLTMPGCNVAINGNLDGTNPNATINASGTAVVGACVDSCGNIAHLHGGASSVSDPLSSLVMPTVPTPCTATFSGAGTIATGCYSSITIDGSATFSPGTTIIKGLLKVKNNSTVRGTGVTLYFAGTAASGACTAAAATAAGAGCVSVDNSSDWQLTAPTSGVYTGILMIQDRNNQLNAEFDGNNPIYNLSGAMYFPNANVSFRNGLNGSNDCMLFVAKTLVIENGNGSFANTCSAYGGSPLKTISVAE